MKIIEKLSEMIDEELSDAKKYAKCALEYKETDPMLAKTFFELSTEEMRHMELLHKEVVRQISEHRKEKGDPPAAMQTIYDYLHGKQVEKAEEVKRYQNMYCVGFA